MCHGRLSWVWHSHVLVVHAAVKCDSRVEELSQWAGLPVTLHNIFIRADSRLYGSQSGAAMEPKEQEEKQAFVLRTKDRQGIQI